MNMSEPMNIIVNEIVDTIVFNETVTNEIGVTKPIKQSKKRATVEYNGMELLVAILVCDVSITNYIELLTKIEEMKNETHINVLSFNKPGDFNNYVDDILKKISMVDEYITNFRTLTANFKFDGIKCVYISGKKNTHTKIQELNKLVEKKSAKSDIYVEYADGQIVGISVKQSRYATKSNYSIHKLISTDADKQLTNIKKNYLKENGFSRYDRLKREQVNALFYPQNKTNPYWNGLKQEITNNKTLIIKYLIEPLFCLNVPYDVYEFDGKSFSKLNNIIDISTVTFEEHLPYYLKKTNEERKTAKLFYRLVVGDKIFRVEVRWKGNIHNASPQFQIHNDDE